MFLRVLKYFYRKVLILLKYSKRIERNEQIRISKRIEIDGIELLDRITDIGKRYNKSIWLEFGTLLGAFRDKSFIPYDYDIDISMIAEEYDLNFENALIKAGFKKKHFFYQYRDGLEPFLTEVTWSYHGINIDIFLNFDSGGNRKVYCYGMKDEISFKNGLWGVREYTFGAVHPLKKCIINNHVFQAPNDTELSLLACYGESYMIPDPNYVSPKQNKYLRSYEITQAYAQITVV